MHEAQRRQARNGGQRAGGNFRDGLAQGRHAGVPHTLGLVLIREAVAQNDGIVDGQRQLQNHRHRIRNKRNGAEDEVGALVQQGRRAESEHQHRHLCVRAGGQGQHQHDDDGGDGQNQTHLRSQIGGIVHAHRGIHIQVVAGKQVLHLMQRVDADVVHLFPVKGHGVQGRCILVVVGGVVKLHRIHTVHRLDLVHQRLGLGVSDVRDHHPGRAEGGKVVVHHRQALAGLSVLTQVGGDVILHIHPAHGHNGEDQRKHIQQKNQVPLVHNERGQLFHSISFGLFFVQICHPFISYPNGAVSAGQTGSALSKTLLWAAVPPHRAVWFFTRGFFPGFFIAEYPTTYLFYLLRAQCP